MSINVTTERIDSCKLFNKMTKKMFYERKKCFFDKLAYNSSILANSDVQSKLYPKNLAMNLF